MKKINIEGFIGWDVLASDIRKGMEESEGEDLSFHLNTPGGFVTEGVAIYNLIAMWPGKTEIVIVSEASSMGSYIAMAADKVKAFDNAMFMIHNASTFVWGDHKDLQIVADRLSRISSMIGKKYAKKTGKSESEISQLMDDETFFFGDEIKEAGFADEIIETDEGGDKDEALALSKESQISCMNKIRDSGKAQKDIENAAEAMNIKATAKIVNNTEDKIVDINDLKQKYPEVYAQVATIERKAGVDQEKDRAEAHLTMGEQCGDMSIAVEVIKSGENMTQTLTARYMAAGMNKKDLTNISDDDKELGNVDSNLANKDENSAGEQIANLVSKKMGVIDVKSNNN